MNVILLKEFKSLLEVISYVLNTSLRLLKFYVFFFFTIHLDTSV